MLEVLEIALRQSKKVFFRGAAELVRNQGAARLFAAQAATEHEHARALYIDNQIKVARIKAQGRAQRDRKNQRRREILVSQLAVKKMKRNAERAMAMMKKEHEVQWPQKLMDSGYAVRRQEIERVAKRYATTDHKTVEQVGVRTAIRKLAQDIIAVEQAGKLDAKESKIVRTLCSRSL